VAISEGLMGDPLLIGLFLVDLLWCWNVTGKAGNKKTPQPGGSVRGSRVTVRYQWRLMCHALGKDDDDAGNESHAFSFPSGVMGVNEQRPDLTMWTTLSTL
jgi:hypothetical protein